MRAQALVKMWVGAIALLLSLQVSAEPLRIVATIKPLALMAATVAGDSAEVSTLLPPGTSPHDVALRVSDRRLLAAADLLLWVGPELEPYMKPLAAGRDQISLSQFYDTEPHASDHSHGHGDPHLWMSRTAAIAFLRALAERLGQHDAQQAADFKARAEAEIARLQQISVQVVADPSPYAAIHPAFGLWVTELGLPEPLVLSDAPEIPPSARALWRITKTLQPNDCLLVEWPGAKPWQQAMAEKNRYRLLTIDLMGYREGVSTYSEVLEILTGQLRGCLTSSTEG